MKIKNILIMVLLLANSSVKPYDYAELYSYILSNLKSKYEIAYGKATEFIYGKPALVRTMELIKLKFKQSEDFISKNPWKGSAIIFSVGWVCSLCYSYLKDYEVEYKMPINLPNFNNSTVNNPAQVPTAHFEFDHELSNKEINEECLQCKDGTYPILKKLIEENKNDQIKKNFKKASKEQQLDIARNLFCFAIEKHNFDTAKLFSKPLLDSNKLAECINFNDEKGFNLLTRIIENGDIDSLVYLLISYGDHFSLNIKDKNGNTPLGLAIKQELEDKNKIDFQYLLVKSLLQFGANPDFRCANEMTPLMIAASKGLTKIVELLLENKAKKDLKDDKEKTALIYAQENKHDSIVKILEGSNESVTDKNNQNTTSQP